MSPAAALRTLRREAPHHYDPALVEAWSKLLCDAMPEIAVQEVQVQAMPSDDGDKRRFKRFEVKCKATLHQLELVKGIWVERETFEGIGHNLSRGGLGVLSKMKLKPGDYYRVKLHGKDGMARTLDIMIVMSRPYSDGWFEAGGRFVDLAHEAAPLPNGEFV